MGGLYSASKGRAKPTHLTTADKDKATEAEAVMFPFSSRTARQHLQSMGLKVKVYSRNFPSRYEGAALTCLEETWPGPTETNLELKSR